VGYDFSEGIRRASFGVAQCLGPCSPLWRQGISFWQRRSGPRAYRRRVDIPFPHPIRDALLAEGLAEEHRWVPNSGWITFRVRSDKDFHHAVWLMRLSYLRYALKKASDPRSLFERENEELCLTPRFKALLEKFVPLGRAVEEPLTL